MKKRNYEEQIHLLMLLIGIVAFACSLPVEEELPDATVSIPHGEVEISYVSQE